MRKEITKDVDGVIKSERSAFMSAYEEAEKIRAEILTETERLETLVQNEKARREVAAGLRVTLLQVIRIYQDEVERVRIEWAAVSKARDERRKAKEILASWENQCNNARVQRNRERLQELESNKPIDPESILIPEVKPIDEQTEAQGIAALQELACAMNDCALAIIDRRRCQELIAELSEKLESAECDLIDKRKIFDKEVDRAMLEHVQRIETAKLQREREINALKQARKNADARLKALGCED